MSAIDKTKDAWEGLRRRINRHELYCAVFQSPEGQRVLEDMCKSFHVTTPTFTPGDPTVTAFKEGQRHVILSILRYVNKDTTELIKQIEKGLTNEDS